jgi:hypothetical protein
MRKSHFADKLGRTVKNPRWFVAGLLCLCTALNFLDRQALPVLAGNMQRELRLDDAEYSWITSSFWPATQ